MVNRDVRRMLQTLKEQIGVVLKTKPARETVSSAGMLEDFLFCGLKFFKNLIK